MKNIKIYKLNKLIEKQGRIWTAAAGGAMAAAMVFGANQTMAVAATETDNYTVSVIVNNAFTMTETTAISFGTPGVVTITGAPPFTAMTITVLTTMNATGLGYSLTTDAAGELVIQIGGTLTTEITANLYTNGTYTGTYVITVSY